MWILLFPLASYPGIRDTVWFGTEMLRCKVNRRTDMDITYSAVLGCIEKKEGGSVKLKFTLVQVQAPPRSQNYKGWM